MDRFPRKIRMSPQRAALIGVSLTALAVALLPGGCPSDAVGGGVDGGGGDGGNSVVAGDSSLPLTVTPKSLDFSSAVERLTLVVRYFGAGSLAVRFESDAAWLRPARSEATITGGWLWLDVSVDRSGLTGGEHAASLTVRPADAASALEAVVVPVKLLAEGTAKSNGGTKVSETNLFFGPTTVAQTVVLERTTGSELEYDVSASAAWVQVPAAGGRLVESFAPIGVQVDLAALPETTASAVLTIRVSNGDEHVVGISASRGGGGLPPTLEVSATTLDFGRYASVLPLEVWQSDDGRFSYAVESPAGWVQVAPPSGEVGGGRASLSVSLDRGQLAPGAHFGVLTVATAQGQKRRVYVLATAPDPADPGETLWEWPDSDKRLVIHATAGEGLIDFGNWQAADLDRWADESIIWRAQLILSVIRQWNGDPEVVLQELLTAARGHNDGILVGMQISGGDCRKLAEMKKYPYETIPYEELPADGYLTGYNAGTQRATVDLRIPDVRQLYTDLIVNDALSHNVDFLYLDNIRYAPGGGTPIPWSTMCAFLSEIRTRLHADGMRTSANVGLNVSGVSDEEAQLLSNAVDGLTFEQPFHPTWGRPYAAMVAREIEIHRRWLDAGKNIQFINVWAPPGGSLDDQQRIMAAMAMIVRRPGDPLFLHRFWWMDTPEFADWPTTFGLPLGDYTMTGEPPVVRREFQHATLIVDVGKSLDGARAGDAVTIIWK